MRKEQISSMLPVVFQKTRMSGEPLEALLDVMELLHEPADHTLANIEKFYNPYHAPDTFMPYLASWVGVSQFFGDYTSHNKPNSADKLNKNYDPIPSGMGCLRELVASATRLARLRGTSKGLIEVLEVATGIKDIKINEQALDESGIPKPFFIEISVPRSGELFKQFITKIIELEKPVYITYRLKFI